MTDFHQHLTRQCAVSRTGRRLVKLFVEVAFLLALLAAIVTSASLLALLATIVESASASGLWIRLEF
jgi:hypothetical protein